MSDVQTLTMPELLDSLRAKAKGWLPEEAATELLIAHGTWLRRDSTRRYITLSDPDNGPLLAGINWNALAADNPLFGSETAVLWFAVSLVRDQAKVSVWDLISSLDATNLGLCMQAMAHAKGWHERGVQATVTGAFTDDDLDADPHNFSTARRTAYRMLGDAADSLTAGDFEPPLTSNQKADVASFRQHVHQAKEALNRATTP